MEDRLLRPLWARPATLHRKSLSRIVRRLAFLWFVSQLTCILSLLFMMGQ